MLSLVAVVCPHCGARGQIMMPPIGSIILGPCPQCNELVVIFCGAALPLSKDIMLGEDIQQKRDHLLSALVDFMAKRVEQVVEEFTAAEHAMEEIEDDGAPGDTPIFGPTDLQHMTPLDTISEAELDHFINVDLKLLDNRDYFRTIFKSEG